MFQNQLFILTSHKLAFLEKKLTVELGFLVLMIILLLDKNVFTLIE